MLYKKRRSFNKPYLGAGGAIGVSLNYLFPTKVICGSSFFFNSLKLNKIINSKTKILISTEGRFDNTSFLGKGFDFLKKYCEKKKIKFFFIKDKSLINFKKKDVIVIKLMNKKIKKDNFKKIFIKSFKKIILNY